MNNTNDMNNNDNNKNIYFKIVGTILAISF